MGPFFPKKKQRPSKLKCLRFKKKKTWELVKLRLKSICYLLLHHIALPKASCMLVRIVEEGKWRSTERCRERGGGFPDKKYN